METINFSLQARWKPKETAILIVDMWEYHSRKRIADRMAHLAVGIGNLVSKARDLGFKIIHGPSNCMEYYANNPARQRVLNLPSQSKLSTDPDQWMNTSPLEEGEIVPIFTSEYEETAEEQASWYAYLESLGLNPNSPTVRQHPAIGIDSEKDFILQTGNEMWKVVISQGIKHVLVAGVAVNMCIVGRPMAIRPLVVHGVPTALIRDLTDSVYTGKGGITHYQGTELYVQYVERYLCPTITSDQITGEKFVLKDI